MATRRKVFGAEQRAVNVPTQLQVSVEEVEQDKPAENFKDEFPVMAMIDIPSIVETTETVTLKVSQAVYDEYSKTATLSGMSVEELMQSRLANCKTHNALRGLWFSDSERGQLENIVQKWPLESTAQALKLLVKTSVVKIDGLEIALTPEQKRVLTLAMYGGRTPKTFFEGMIKKELRT